MTANPTYQDGSYTTARAVETQLVKQPAFDGDTTLLIGKQDFVQATASYTPLALGTPHDDDPNFLLAKEDNFRDLGEGIQQWTRTYARVPSQRVEGRAVAWNIPGLGIGGTNTIYPVATADINTITTTVDNDFAADDYIVCLWGKITNELTLFLSVEKVGTVSNPRTFSVSPPQPLAATYQIKSVQKVFTGGGVNFGRLPEQKTVNAIVAFDYFVSTDGTDITILNPPIVRSSTGTGRVITDTYDYDTTPDLPAYVTQVTAAQNAANNTFAKLLAADALIVVQPSTPRRWQGNIWERETVYVRAQ